MGADSPLELSLISLPIELLLSGHLYLSLCFKDKHCMLLQCTTQMHQQATTPEFLLGKNPKLFNTSSLNFYQQSSFLFIISEGKGWMIRVE